jgi:hypothetical protein
MTPGADERIAQLYGLPLDRFTPERNALAAALRSEGDSQAAAAVKALRKPSAAAWAVNQLVRAEPDLVEALLGAGGELRQAHRRAAAGHGAEQLRAATDAEREAVERLMARAPTVLGRAPSAALAEAMRNTLHATSSDDEARELVHAGTLTIELRPVGLGPVPGALARTARRPKEDSEHADALKAAVAEERALRRELDAATRALDRAEEAYLRAREAADAAAGRAQEAETRLRSAQARFAEAQGRRKRLDRRG